METKLVCLFVVVAERTRLAFPRVLGRRIAASLVSTRTFRAALTASVDSCAEIKSAPSAAYITSSGRVWRKVPESEARSVRLQACLAVGCNGLSYECDLHYVAVCCHRPSSYAEFVS